MFMVKYAWFVICVGLMCYGLFTGSVSYLVVALVLAVVLNLFSTMITLKHVSYFRGKKQPKE